MKTIRPIWDAPARIRAASSTRAGGVSEGEYSSLNLGAHVDDDPPRVDENRRRFVADAGAPAAPDWLDQVHGDHVVCAAELPSLRGGDDEGRPRKADAVYTRTPGVVCAVMTADCLPVLFASADGLQVAAAHAGWRGLAAGVLERTVDRFEAGAEIHAWLGPAIGPQAFEVSQDVLEAFRDVPGSERSFRPRGDRFLADLYELARLRLRRAGVSSISGGDRCTFSEPEEFFSYRRDGPCGRMASAVWIDPESP
ncbi:MAG: peptidoglycan editing factor PgeF [Planctomycetota bacterium]